MRCYAVPIRLEAIRCNEHLIDAFKTDLAGYLRQHGLDPAWADVEQTHNPQLERLFTVALYRPAERVNAADVIRSLKQINVSPGTSASGLQCLQAVDQYLRICSTIQCWLLHKYVSLCGISYIQPDDLHFINLPRSCKPTHPRQTVSEQQS